MFQKILIATDLSPASDCLVGCAAELKALGLQQAVLAHVVYVANTPGLENLLEEKARPELERQKDLLEAQGIEVEIAMELGIPAHDLNDLAERHDVAAILIGSRGRGLARSALGSVSFKLLQIARRPVFLSRINVLGEGDQCRISTCMRPFENILFATDFSDTSEHAFAHLKDLVRECRAAVTILHVLENQHAAAHLSQQMLEEMKGLDMRRLEEMKHDLERMGSKVALEWIIGNPQDEIIERTRAGGYSLVVMGNHGKGIFREALFGSVANDVARSAMVPVLFIPALR